jgi:hypothetical protein
MSPKYSKKLWKTNDLNDTPYIKNFIYFFEVNLYKFKDFFNQLFKIIKNFPFFYKFLKKRLIYHKYLS